MKRTPNIISLTPQWLQSLNETQTSHDGKVYYPSRPMGFWSFRYRAKAALMVFKGDADALVWPPHAHQDPRP